MKKIKVILCGAALTLGGCSYDTTIKPVTYKYLSSKCDNNGRMLQLELGGDDSSCSNIEFDKYRVTCMNKATFEGFCYQLEREMEHEK